MGIDKHSHQHVYIQTHSQLQKGMFVVETKVPAHSILVDFHNVHFWRMPLELFYRKDFFQPKWPHINTRPPKNLLKKQAA